MEAPQSIDTDGWKVMTREELEQMMETFFFPLTSYGRAHQLNAGFMLVGWSGADICVLSNMQPDTQRAMLADIAEQLPTMEPVTVRRQ